ncbi:MAG: hypothetical protein U5J83_04310, partial [Bryobacterales bacterium]|nr:hypothetical protein [Bryobacterales bacterium]
RIAVVEPPAWNAAFLDAARKRGVRILGDISKAPAENTTKALEAGVDALYLEGNFPEELVAQSRAQANSASKGFAWLPDRMHMPIGKTGEDAPALVGTYQGLWAGVKLGHEGEAEAAPSGPPWIETNSGFLRFARTVAPKGVPVWIANRPPLGQAIPMERYLQAIGDAAMAGGRWVISFDEDFAKKLLAGDGGAKKTWERMNTLLRFYEQHRELTELPDYSKLAIVQDVDSGALVSGSVLDMVSSKHVPAFVLLPRWVCRAMPELKLLLNIDPQSLTEEQKARPLRREARKGAMLINGPPQWKLTLPPPAEMTFTDGQIKQLDEIWSEINRTLGRDNFAVRVFGAPAMLSNLKATAGRPKKIVPAPGRTDSDLSGGSDHDPRAR